MTMSQPQDSASTHAAAPPGCWGRGFASQNVFGHFVPYDTRVLARPKNKVLGLAPPCNGAETTAAVCSAAEERRYWRRRLLELAGAMMGVAHAPSRAFLRGKTPTPRPHPLLVNTPVGQAASTCWTFSKITGGGGHSLLYGIGMRLMPHKARGKT